VCRHIFLTQRTKSQLIEITERRVNVDTRGAIVFSDGKGTLTDDGESMIIDGLVILSDAVRLNNFEKGWRTEDSEPRNVGELVSLIHSEATEVLEAWRDHEPGLWFEYPTAGRGFVSSEINFKPAIPATEIMVGDNDPEEMILGKPQGMAAELADIIIRVLDTADELNLPVVDAVLYKHRYNQTRPFRHGGKKA
jgi:hypothetical protein